MALIRSRFPDLSDFFSDDWFHSKVGNGGWAPAINVVDNEDNYEVEVAAPGIKKDDFKIQVENGVLTISGESSKEEEEERKNYTRKEFSSRSFSKSFTLPDNVEAEQVSAKHEDGVLRLTLKKIERELPSKKEVLID